MVADHCHLRDHLSDCSGQEQYSTQQSRHEPVCQKHPNMCHFPTGQHTHIQYIYIYTYNIGCALYIYILPNFIGFVDSYR